MREWLDFQTPCPHVTASCMHITSSVTFSGSFQDITDDVCQLPHRSSSCVGAMPSRHPCGDDRARWPWQPGPCPNNTRLSNHMPAKAARGSRASWDGWAYYMVGACCWKVLDGKSKMVGIRIFGMIRGSHSLLCQNSEFLGLNLLTVISIMWLMLLTIVTNGTG